MTKLLLGIDSLPWDLYWIMQSGLYLHVSQKTSMCTLCKEYMKIPHQVFQQLELSWGQFYPPLLPEIVRNSFICYRNIEQMVLHMQIPLSRISGQWLAFLHRCRMQWLCHHQARSGQVREHCTQYRHLQQVDIKMIISIQSWRGATPSPMSSAFLAPMLLAMLQISWSSAASLSIL